MKLTDFKDLGKIFKGTKAKPKPKLSVKSPGPVKYEPKDDSGRYRPTNKTDLMDVLLKRNVLKPFDQMGEENVDWLNVGPAADTGLGKFLSMGHKERFEHPYFGSFDTLGGYMSLLRTDMKHDEFRSASWQKIRRLNKSVTLGHVRSFKAHVMVAVAWRLKTNRKMLEQFVEFDGAFDFFYVTKSGHRARTNFSEWYTDILYQLRSLLRIQKDGIYFDGNLLRQFRWHIHREDQGNPPKALSELKVDFPQSES